MNEKTDPQTQPRSGRDDATYPQGRTEREMGTHEGGRNRPPHPADKVHGDLPEELPSRYREKKE